MSYRILSLLGMLSEFPDKNKLILREVSQRSG